jgi:hypothetical protein
MLPLSLSIVSKIKIGTEAYFSKNGYHVSLIRLVDLTKSDQQKVLNFTKTYPVKLKEITKIYRLVTEKNLQSVMVLVRLQGLKKLILAVNHHFGYNFIYPPTHITLFTLKDQKGGIGVNSASEYRQLTRQVSQNDSRRLTRSFNLI